MLLFFFHRCYSPIILLFSNCGKIHITYNLPCEPLLCRTYSLVILSIFTLLNDQTAELFHPTKLKLCTHQTTAPHSFTLQLRATTILPSVSVNLTALIPHVSRVIQYLSFRDWFLALGTVSSRFIHVVAGVRISFMLQVEQHSIVRACRIEFAQSSVCQRLSPFLLL